LKKSYTVARKATVKPAAKPAATAPATAAIPTASSGGAQ
jgi:hypothetical protein